MVQILGRRAFAAVMALAVVLGGADSARVRACEPPACCVYKTVVCYEPVVVVETHTEAYTRVVTLYDDCGCPYQVKQTCYRKVRVPVRKMVAITKRVKVCD